MNPIDFCFQRPYPGVNPGPVVIPKIIMQSWKTKDVPERWRESKPAYEKFLPGWRHVHMTDEDNRNLVATHFPDFLPYYDAFPYNIMRADASRYVWLYVYGGVYSDYDIVPQHFLEDLFQHGEIFFIHSSLLKSRVTNCFMASVPGHPIWLEMIEEMKKQTKFPYTLNKNFIVLNTTGPEALTRVLAKTKYPYVKLPNNVLSNSNYCGGPPNPDHYLRDLQGSSWIDSGMDFLYKTGYCYRWQIGIIVLLIIIFLLILIGIWVSRWR